jgi:hypothetical protein
LGTKTLKELEEVTGLTSSRLSQVKDLVKERLKDNDTIKELLK